ncbi:hypothetical protein PP7435_CHR1-1516 [Komagataella phaffii CBS 7435]|uniref:NAD(P)-binding domain-containing protein n=2 Tax=Komagataella phaffii TaxID=460519 RepID=C4QZ90_KOMPG|nr:uncharacterized protein PAS_FragB_0034 [Komagataella phaffii GS115]AOA61083.1 GQ67_01429T0 [Komagataella phaffii]CAH2447395.1 hypothetical protein BQ9382_C1-7905 [Komagataella phaffii CBS 7435]AOA66125.1 GQ68_01445T0 [Komagataella phaffii GS115]CAY68564.1 hypothetical protein PAS_FragB_0034 [Komagataella phaffii GS115]CCA37627.1 hypothetical protein PP7435_CHR1-1516 [Komagataella phaffii CBS 7435]
MANKVAIFGAHGKVAQLLISKLGSSKYEPLALVRKQEQVDDFIAGGVDAKLISLEDDTLGKIAEAIKGCSAVVFSAGAGGKGGADRTVAVDLDSAVKAMEATELNNIKRFIMVSAIGADDRDFWYWNIPSLRTYYICKKYADRELRRTNLDWTILQPGALKDIPEKGSLQPENEIFQTKTYETVGISRADVAEVILQSLEHPSTIHKTLTLINGDVPIQKWIKNHKN